MNQYNLIIPRIDKTGPCNVAIDIANAASKRGFLVSIFYLSGDLTRPDISPGVQVKQFSWVGVFSMSGVVHTHCLRPDLLGALISLRKDCFVISTIHNYFLADLSFDHKRWKVRIAWFFWKLAMSRIDRRVCISNSMRRYYKRMVPGMAFDVAFNFRSDLDLVEESLSTTISTWLSQQKSRGNICMAFIGSLSPRKNLPLLLESLKKNPEISLIICGEGPQRSELESICAELGLKDSVYFAGQVASPSNVLAHCDMLVLPSFAEGLPLVAIESIRVGRPCLLSNISVHRELAGMGLGLTFNRYSFDDFGAKAHLLSNSSTSQGKDTLQDLWRTKFSESVGFERYLELVTNDLGE